MENDAYQNLANAIIIQAAQDYRKALRQLKQNPNYDAAMDTKNEVEQFFHSEWFGQMTKLDPDDLLDRIVRTTV